MPRVLPPDVHRRLDEALPPHFHTINTQILENAEDILHSLLRRCRDVYSSTWPVNIDAANRELLESRADIHHLLQNCQKNGDYAEIRELPEFHMQDLTTLSTPRILPPEVHRRLDQDIPSILHAAAIQELKSAECLLQSVLRQCRDAYSTTWPVNIAAATEALLESRPDIYHLLENCQRNREYAEIRELREFHRDLGILSTPSPPHNDEQIIQNGIHRADHFMNKYFDEKPQLPTFQAPPDISDQLRKHINDLKMPLSLDGGRLPSLLMHNLHHCSSDAHSQCLEKLFDVRDKVKFICNASGSGKTRMLLEGLTTRWGLYFTSRADEIGSTDLSDILYDLNTSTNLRDLPPMDHHSILQQNVTYTNKRFSQLLLARVMIMASFLQRLSAEADVITHKHIEEWLLIQLAPKTLLGEDIFAVVTSQLMSLKMDYDELRRRILLVSFKIHDVLGLALNKLICVLDEAQHTSDMLTTKFMSIDGRSERPVLREQLVAWGYSMPHILVSGTGLSMVKREQYANPGVAKDVISSYEVFMETDAFDTLVQQKHYLEQYFPSGYFENEEGAALLSRIGYWLHGRHRFTAAYVARLIATGFKSPHRMLNRYVLDMTKYEPLDAMSLTEKEPPLDNVHAVSPDFDRNKLGKDDGLRRLIASVVFEYIVTGVPRNIHVTEHAKLVELGAARFAKKAAIFDEPLALLSVLNYFSENTGWTREYFRQNSTLRESDGDGVKYQLVVQNILHSAMNVLVASSAFPHLNYRNL